MKRWNTSAGSWQRRLLGNISVVMEIVKVYIIHMCLYTLASLALPPTLHTRKWSGIIRITQWYTVECMSYKIATAKWACDGSGS